MIDNEIINALARMSEEDPNGFSSDILDFVKHKNAEIEKKDTEIAILNRKNETLKDEVSALRSEVDMLNENIKAMLINNAKIGRALKQLKSEARKEFAERLKEIYFDDKDIANMFWVKAMEHIDNLLAEMESERE